jgi:orotate phosphoribosyltransferase
MSYARIAMNENTAILERLKTEIMLDIYEKRMVLTSIRDKPEGWTLHSGMWSPFYIQLRELCSHPATLAKVGKALSILVREQAPLVNRLVGVAFAGVPIATAVSIESGIPACHTRKILGVRTEEEMQQAISAYGQHSFVEGIIEEGDVLCLVDDLVTGMESKVVARTQVLAEVEKRGLSDVVCDDIAVIIDRHQGAKQRAMTLGLQLHCLIDIVYDGLLILKDSMSDDEYSLVSDYLRNPEGFEKPK